MDSASNHGAGFTYDEAEALARAAGGKKGACRRSARVRPGGGLRHLRVCKGRPVRAHVAGIGRMSRQPGRRLRQRTGRTAVGLLARRLKTPCSGRREGRGQVPRDSLGRSASGIIAGRLREQKEKYGPSRSPYSPPRRYILRADAAFLIAHGSRITGTAASVRCSARLRFPTQSAAHRRATIKTATSSSCGAASRFTRVRP